MLTEPATIIAIEPGGIWIEAQRRSHCSGCSAGNTCGHALMNCLIRQQGKQVRISLEDVITANLHVGDTVTVGIPESGLLNMSLLLYLLPVAGLLSGAFLAQVVAAGEAVAIVFAFAGLALGFYLAGRFSITGRRSVDLKLVQVNSRAGREGSEGSIIG